ncbi:hypothetical protein ACLOJK_015224 [Asimina triloba]
MGGYWWGKGSAATVTYDHRALVINGQRRILFSGSIHYPRSTPEVIPIARQLNVWPDLIRKSKEGGLDVIETYVFWNYHEPVKGQYYFEGRFDLVRFVKTVQEAGLGFPMWLHFIPGIQFRTTNAPFKNEMMRFLEKIVSMMKDEKLFASQGGPIILSQVENEYGNVEWAYGVGGELYVQWAAETAVSLNTSVPWVMCQQEDAPDPIYFGGTNFGRTAGGPLVATSYDYDAPIDEYGMFCAGFIRQPKWGHLRDLHMAIKHCEQYLVQSDPTYAHVYYRGANDCAAFLANIDQAADANISFNGNSYSLPAWSVSILPDCKNVIFNTAKVVAQRSMKDYTHEQTSNMEEDTLTRSSWGWYKEQVGIWSNNSFTSPSLLEQINTTKDVSDFLWYALRYKKNYSKMLFVQLIVSVQRITLIDVDESGMEAILNIASLGHAAMVFVNKRFVGFGYGNHEDASFILNKKITLKQGKNSLDLLSMMIGVQNYGPWFDIAGAGIFSVNLVDLKNAQRDLSLEEWSYQTTFTAPEGNGPLTLNLASMGKGQAWVNGLGIGRHSIAYHAPTNGCSQHCDYRGSYDASKCLKNCGQPSQILYHIPRSWVHPGDNLLVIHEELGGDPSKITISTRTGQRICAHVSELDPAPVDSWKQSSKLKATGPQVRLNCERGWKITSINFASFGNPTGECGEFSHGRCSADNVLPVIQKVPNPSASLLNLKFE